MTSSFANATATNASSSLCSIESFPFDFFAANGTRVAGELDPSGSYCIFPNASCSPTSPIADCCKAKDNVENTGDKFMFMAFAFIMIPSIFLGNSGRESSDQRNERHAKMIPSWVRNVPGPIAIPIFMCGMYAYIAMLITVPIVMRIAIQQTLNVVNRNAVIAAEAFMVPYNQIFQFIEDIVMVRVNYALALRQRSLANELVHVGLLGSLGTGIIAAVLATILGVIPPALAGLTNPGALNDQQLYPGCDLITDSTSSVLPYWLVESWAIPGKQMGMVMTGFMMGAMELPTVGWIGATGISLILLVWFVFVKTASNPLLVLAFAEFSASWAIPILSIAYLVSPLGSDLRNNTGVYLTMSKFKECAASLLTGSMTIASPDGGGVENVSDPVPPNDGERGQHSNINDPPSKSNDIHEEVALEDIESVSSSDEVGASTPSTTAAAPRHLPAAAQSTRALLMEGFKIMFMDVAVQFCVSLSIYLALARDGAEAYQLTALQSALPTYGIAYAMGMGVVMKLVGPQLLANGHIRMFVKFVRITVVCTLLLVPLIVGSSVPFSSGLSYSYGANACGYAKNDQCVSFFNRVFGPNSEGGKYTLPFTFEAFPMGAAADAVFFVLRSVLLTMVDLDYMVKCTLVAIVAYIPAIAVVSAPAFADTFGGKAISFFVVMYFPQVILCVLFAVRIHLVLKRMLATAKEDDDYRQEEEEEEDVVVVENGDVVDPEPAVA